jgi:hypothetical protein
MSDIDIKPSNHTLRRNFYGFFIEKRDTLGRTYIPTDNGLIPITEVDDLFSQSDMEFFNSGPYWEKSFTLNKRELFVNVIAICEEFATKKTVTYDKKLGLDEIVYEVPAIGYLNLNEEYTGNDIVKYRMYITRGKHRHNYSLEMDCITSCPYGRKCRYCRENGKGVNKEKYRMFKEQCFNV